MRAVKSVTIDSERRVIITYLDDSIEVLLPITLNITDILETLKGLEENKANAITEHLSNSYNMHFADGADNRLIIAFNGKVSHRWTLNSAPSVAQPNNIIPQRYAEVFIRGENLFGGYKKFNGYINQSGQLVRDDNKRSYAIRVPVYSQLFVKINRRPQPVGGAPDDVRIAFFTNEPDYGLSGRVASSKEYTNDQVSISVSTDNSETWMVLTLGDINKTVIEYTVQNTQVSTTASISSMEYKGKDYVFDIGYDGVDPGVVDLIKGVYECRYKMFTLTGNEPWVWDDNTRWAYTTLKGVVAPQQPNVKMSLYCNMGTSVGQVYLDGYRKLFFKAPDNVSNLNELLTFFNNNNLQVICPMASNEVIKFNVESMYTHKGVNNVFYNGLISDFTYTADTKLYVDSKISEG